jgi:Fe2+ transport system protein B
MKNQIINKNDIVKFKNDSKCYCVVSFDLQENFVYVFNVHGVVVSEIVENEKNNKKFKISDIDKIILKESQQKKIVFPETIEDKIKSIDLQIKNTSLTLTEIKNLKKKKAKLVNKISDNKNNNVSIIQSSLF